MSLQSIATESIKLILQNIAKYDEQITKILYFSSTLQLTFENHFFLYLSINVSVLLIASTAAL